MKNPQSAHDLNSWTSISGIARHGPSRQSLGAVAALLLFSCFPPSADAQVGGFPSGPIHFTTPEGARIDLFVTYWENVYDDDSNYQETIGQFILAGTTPLPGGRFDLDLDLADLSPILDSVDRDPDISPQDFGVSVKTGGANGINAFMISHENSGWVSFELIFPGTGSKPPLPGPVHVALDESFYSPNAGTYLSSYAALGHGPPTQIADLPDSQFDGALEANVFYNDIFRTRVITLEDIEGAAGGSDGYTVVMPDVTVDYSVGDISVLNDPDYPVYFAPGVRRKFDGAELQLGSSSESYVLDGALKLGAGSFATFNSSGPARIQADISTAGGGLRSATGFSFSSETLRSQATSLLESVKVGTIAQMQQVAAQSQLASNFAQLSAEQQKTSPRFTLLEQTQLSMTRINQEVNKNRAVAYNFIASLMAQLIARSTIEGDVDFLGDLTVGGDGEVDGTETILIAGDLLTRPFAALRFDLGGSTAGDEHDQISIDGNLNLGELTELHIHLIDDGTGQTFIPEFGEFFDLIVADSIDFAPVLPVLDDDMPSDRTLMLGVVALPGGGQALRAVTVVNTIPKLGPPVSIERLGDDVRIKFQTRAGTHYRVDYTDSLPAQEPWPVLEPTVVGTGVEVTVTDTNAVASDQRFYRVAQTD